MRIGIDARFYGSKSKGLGRYNQKLIENLEKIDNHNCYVIFLRFSEYEIYQPKNPNFKKVLADYRWYSLAEQIFLPFKIYRQKIDLMHFTHFNVPFFYRRPFITTIHDLILQYFSNERAGALLKLKYRLKNLAYKLLIKSVVRRAARIITVSNYVKNDIEKCFKIDFSKIIVTYEGAPPAETSDKGQVTSLDRYGISKLYSLYVGNAYPHKNLERLIEAFKILQRVYKQDLRLVLTGESDYFYGRLKEKTFTSMSPSTEVNAPVVFTGFVNDEELEILYQNAELFVFPSLCEGFGLPPLEAMARGVPVVSSDATCLPEILGQAAVYFNALDPRDIAQKIKEVLNDENLRRVLISRGFEQIKKYSWEKMGRETRDVYLSIKI